MQGVKKSIQEEAESDIFTWDSKYEEEVMVIPYDHFHGVDSPIQAEECNHKGLKCNYFCWTCKVGGTNVEKRTDRGYIDLFTCGELWTSKRMLAEIKEQIRLSMLSGGTTKVKAKLQQELYALLDGQSLDDHINPLLGMAGLNIHQDTPTEILHTILLGVTVYILDKANFLGIFQTCLDSVETRGLGSTILGADYTSPAQVMPYLIYDLLVVLL
ncbi:hypothetical protein V8B97DRAFT_2022926 [Scleroderma yunnanense]